MNHTAAETRPECAGASAALTASGLLAVLRANHAEQYAPVVETLVAAELNCIELTLTTPGTLAALPALRQNVPATTELGVGTVTTVEQARATAEAGADFLVTPTTNPDIVTVAVRAGIPVYPGGLTPTELYEGWTAGAAAVKLFPASTVRPEYLTQLRGPFPDLHVIPSGGINLDDAAQWIKSGSLAVSIGGPLLRDVFTNGDYDALQQRTERLVKTVAEAVANQ